MMTSFEQWDFSEPLIVLSCGHIFDLETLDGHMDMERYYERKDSKYIAPKPV